MIEAIDSAMTTHRWPLATYSVRTGFDLFLAEMDWEISDEIVSTGINIPHIDEIARSHGYEIVPVEVEIDSCASPAELIDSAITPKTRAILVTHLFGTQVDLSSIVEVARKHGLVLIEDCAQAFRGCAYPGDERADISMFSFGTIKTATALGGGVLIVKDSDIRDRMAKRQAAYPQQGALTYAVKCFRVILLLIIGKPVIYGLFFRVAKMVRLDYDRLIRAASRGFSRSDLLRQIRRRMSDALVATLARRITNYEPNRVSDRAITGRFFAALLGDHVAFLGQGAPFHSFWLFPVVVANPEQVVEQLRSSGFDATRGTSVLVALAPSASRRPPKGTALAVDHIVYVPVYPGVSCRDLRRMADVLNQTSQRFV